MNASCKDCRFGKPVYDGNQQLEAVECHRNAPAPLTIGTNGGVNYNEGVRWPLMYPNDFCGEYE